MVAVTANQKFSLDAIQVHMKSGATAPPAGVTVDSGSITTISQFVPTQGTGNHDFSGLTLTDADLLVVFLVTTWLNEFSDLRWDPTGVNDQFTQIAVANPLTDYKVAAYACKPTAMGNKVLRLITGGGAANWYLGAIAFKGTNATLGTAITQQTTSAAGQTQSRVDSYTAPDNHRALIMNCCPNSTCDQGTWSPTPNGSSVYGVNNYFPFTGFLNGAGATSLTLVAKDQFGTTVTEWCHGLAFDISP